MRAALEDAAVFEDKNLVREDGSICANGNGVPQDTVQAYRWFTLAANQGHENAKTLRELVAQQMTPAQIAEAEALAED